MRKAKFFLAALLTVLLLTNAQLAVNCAQRAMRLWASSVAPALFPFLALLPLLTGPEACAAYNAALSRLMRPVFNLPGAAAPAVAIGMLAGSPGGAMAISRIAAQTHMRRDEARRLALALCGLSPAYLTAAVGTLFRDAGFGLGLACVQALVQLCLLQLLRFLPPDEGRIASEPAAGRRRGGVGAAVEAVLGICGYMVVFSVAAGVLSTLVGSGAGTLLLVLSDLPSGLAALDAASISYKSVTLALAVGFGGLCIAAQNIEALRPIGIGWRPFLAARLAAALLTAALSALLLRPNGTASAVAFSGSGKIYALSLLISSLLALPGLIYLTKNFFLNKRSGPVSSPKASS